MILDRFLSEGFFGASDDGDDKIRSIIEEYELHHMHAATAGIILPRQDMVRVEILTRGKVDGEYANKVLGLVSGALERKHIDHDAYMHLGMAEFLLTPTKETIPEFRDGYGLKQIFPNAYDFQKLIVDTVTAWSEQERYSAYMTGEYALPDPSYDRLKVRGDGPLSRVSAPTHRSVFDDVSPLVFPDGFWGPGR